MSKTSIPQTLPIAQIVSATQAEGPGNRFAIWVQGCPFRCPGCCNPEMLAFRGGVETTIDDLLCQIEETQRDAQIEGITLLGGEPFAHAQSLAIIAEAVREKGLSVMVFSGFTLAEIRESNDESKLRLLSSTDLLVDGKYEQHQPDTKRRWIGSTNQEIHFLTDRYQPDIQWQQKDTLEIRLENGQLSVNGFPAKKAAGLWKRPRKNKLS